MGEVLRPTPEQAEDAIAAALARPNPIDDSHEAAREVEEFINDYYHETEDSEETQREYLTKTIRELDQNCGHVGEEIIINGLVKVRDFDHQLIETGGSDIPHSAMNETWQPVEDFIATSMGYFALSDGRNGNRINIYHGAKSPAKRIAYNLSYGEVYKGGRVFVPLDGTAQVELKNAPQTINHELVQYYIGQDYLERIDEALYNAESLSESIQALGRINLQKCMALKIDVDVQRSLINYVNSILDIQQNPLYEISGASFIEYAHSEEHQEVYRVNPRAAVIGNIVGIGIDEDAGRFRLVATVPFGDNLTHTIAYRINKKLTVRKMPAYNLSTTARLTVS